MAACGDDCVVVVVEAVGEFVLAQILPDVLDRVEFGSVGGQEQKRDVARDFELITGVPPGPVENDDGMSIRGDLIGDLSKMGIECNAVGVGHDESGTDGAFGTNRAEDIGPFVTGISYGARSGAALGP